MATNIFDVTVVEAEGDGSYFDFTFEFDKTKETAKYRLYPANGESYPLKEVNYVNNADDNENAERDALVRFVAPMPNGFHAAYQISRENYWKGIKGELTITE